MSGKYVLYISYDGMTDLMGRSQVLPYLKGLSGHGFRFVIISCEKEDRYARYREDVLAFIKGYNIEWVPLTYTKQPPILSTLWDLFRMRRTAIQLHKKYHFAAVHCRSYLPAMIGRSLKLKFGIPFIFDTRGLWVDERVQGGLWNLKNPVYRFVFNYFKKVEIKLYSEADYTITQAEAARRDLHSWKNLKNQPIPVKNIPCCADLDFFDSTHIVQEQKIKLKETLGILPGQVVLGYCGALGTWYMLKEKLEFFKQFYTTIPGSKFLILTTHPKEEIFVEAGKQGIPASAIIAIEVVREKMPLYMSLFDLSVYFIKPASTNVAKSPIKLGELLGMGIPVITNSGVGDVDEILLNSGAGFIVQSFDANGYQEAIDFFLSGKLSAPAKIREVAERIYSLKQGVKNYNEVYCEIIK